MIMKHHIQLIGFDGENYWRLFYIEIRDDEEVYYGLIRKDYQFSFSRHGSGIINAKLGDKKVRVNKLFPEMKTKPIKEIKGLEGLGTFIPSNYKEKISEKEYKKYFSRKCNAIFLIDLRNFTGTLNIQPYLINPNKKELLMKREFKHECQLYLYTKSNPWVAFYILNVIPKRED